MFRTVAACAAALLCLGLAAAQPEPAAEPEATTEPEAAAEPEADDAAEGPNSSAYNAAYERARGVMEKSGLAASPEAADDATLYILGNIANTMFHEFGHGLKSELSLPLTGKEEDAVDSFANVIMVSRETDETLDRMILAVADDYFTAGAFAEEDGGDAPAWDEHSLNQQRAYAVICILVGADPETYKEAADNAGMPPERQEGCQAEYEDALKAWDALLTPYYLNEGEEQKSKPTITYGPPPKGMELIAELVKTSGIVETVTDELFQMVRMPNDIAVTVQACDEANAFWSPDERSLTLCYEIAQGYLDNALVPKE